jgi:hypothetical protein
MGEGIGVNVDFKLSSYIVGKKRQYQKQVTAFSFFTY